MDKLAAQLIALLQDMQTAHERLLGLARARQNAMRSYDVETLNGLTVREEGELKEIAAIEERRKALMLAIRRAMGPAVPATTSEIAKRCAEPMRTKLLTQAAALKTVVEALGKENRINAKMSGAAVKALSKVLKIITGVSQHAGLYLRNGRKAALAGIHLLEVTA